MIFLLVVAAVVVAAPLAAAVLVTVASLREDSARSLAGRPPGLLAAVARRLLGLRTSPATSRDLPPPPLRTDGLAPTEDLLLPPLPTDGLALTHADRHVPPGSDWLDRTLTVPRS